MSRTKRRNTLAYARGRLWTLGRRSHGWHTDPLSADPWNFNGRLHRSQFGETASRASLLTRAVVSGWLGLVMCRPSTIREQTSRGSASFNFYSITRQPQSPANRIQRLGRLGIECNLAAVQCVHGSAASDGLHHAVSVDDSSLVGGISAECISVLCAAFTIAATISRNSADIPTKVFSPCRIHGCTDRVLRPGTSDL